MQARVEPMQRDASDRVRYRGLRRGQAGLDGAPRTQCVQAQICPRERVERGVDDAACDRSNAPASARKVRSGKVVIFFFTQEGQTTSTWLVAPAGSARIEKSTGIVSVLPVVAFFFPVLIARAKTAALSSNCVPQFYSTRHPIDSRLRRLSPSRARPRTCGPGRRVGSGTSTPLRVNSRQPASGRLHGRTCRADDAVP